MPPPSRTRRRTSVTIDDGAGNRRSTTYSTSGTREEDRRGTRRAQERQTEGRPPPPLGRQDWYQRHADARARIMERQRQRQQSLANSTAFDTAADTAVREEKAAENAATDARAAEIEAEVQRQVDYNALERDLDSLDARRDTAAAQQGIGLPVDDNAFEPAAAREVSRGSQRALDRAVGSQRAADARRAARSARRAMGVDGEGVLPELDALARQRSSRTREAPVAEGAAQGRDARIRARELRDRRAAVEAEIQAEMERDRPAPQQAPATPTPSYAPTGNPLLDDPGAVGRETPRGREDIRQIRNPVAHYDPPVAVQELPDDGPVPTYSEAPPVAVAEVPDGPAYTPAPPAPPEEAPAPAPRRSQRESTGSTLQGHWETMGRRFGFAAERARDLTERVRDRRPLSDPDPADGTADGQSYGVLRYDDPSPAEGGGPLAGGDLPELGDTARTQAATPTRPEQGIWAAGPNDYRYQDGSPVTFLDGTPVTNEVDLFGRWGQERGLSGSEVYDALLPPPPQAARERGGPARIGEVQVQHEMAMGGQPTAEELYQTYQDRGADKQRTDDFEMAVAEREAAEIMREEEQLRRAVDIEEQQRANLQRFQTTMRDRMSRLDSAIEDVRNYRIDPSRFFGGVGGRLGASLLVALGGATARPGEANQALGIIERQIDRDIQAQQYDGEMMARGAQMEAQAIQMTRAIFQDEQARQDALYSLYYENAARQLQPLISQSTGQEQLTARELQRQLMTSAANRRARAEAQEARTVRATIDVTRPVFAGQNPAAVAQGTIAQVAGVSPQRQRAQQRRTGGGGGGAAPRRGGGTRAQQRSDGQRPFDPALAQAMYERFRGTPGTGNTPGQRSPAEAAPQGYYPAPAAVTRVVTPTIWDSAVRADEGLPRRIAEAVAGDEILRRSMVDLRELINTHRGSELNHAFFRNNTEAASQYRAIIQQARDGMRRALGFEAPQDAELRILQEIVPGANRSFMDRIENFFANTDGTRLDVQTRDLLELLNRFTGSGGGVTNMLRIYGLGYRSASHGVHEQVREGRGSAQPDIEAAERDYRREQTLVR
jgi:hypothetical protein